MLNSRKLTGFCFFMSLAAQMHAQNLSGIKIADIKPHIAILAADSLQGRKPFTSGEAKTLSYITSQFRKLGLEPGNHGSYLQDVPLVQVNSLPTDETSIRNGPSITRLHYLTDFTASTSREEKQVVLKDSPLIFVGYGIVAPEYHWDDYKGTDVKGKTVVVLINDPGFMAGTQKFFKGDTMTYYGRWTYKYEEAARHGAAGVLIVHQADAASYGWNVIANSFSGPKLYLPHTSETRPACLVEGWLSEDAAIKMLAAGGIQGDIHSYSRSSHFKALDLGQTFSITLDNQIKYAISHNIISVLKGRRFPDETVIYSAHWDHLGIGKPDSEKDSIYNGAIDNASGIASMLAIAKAHAELNTNPDRSVVFVAFTAEEQGLLGSQYYVRHPTFPLSSTVANLNMDVMLDYGTTKDIDLIGRGQNELENDIMEIADHDSLHVIADTNPQAGLYFRSDHFSFAQAGVPSIDFHNGIESTDPVHINARDKQSAYFSKRYHRTTDNYFESMDISGMVQMADIYYRIGFKLSREHTFPAWKKNSEFKSAGEKNRKTGR